MRWVGSQGAALVMTVALIGVLSGCAPTQGSVTTLGGEPGTICAAVPADGEIVFGDVISLVDPARSITMKSVELIGAKGIEVLGTYVLPIDRSDPIMTMSLDNPSQGWAHREKVDGTVLESQPANVVVEVRRSGTEEGTAEAMRVTYSTADGSDYFDEGTTSLRLADECQ